MVIHFLRHPCFPYLNLIDGNRALFMGSIGVRVHGAGHTPLRRLRRHRFDV